MSKNTPEKLSQPEEREGVEVSVEDNLRNLDTTDLFENATKSLAAKTTELAERINSLENPEPYQQKLHEILARHTESLRKNSLVGRLLDRDRQRITPEVIGGKQEVAKQDGGNEVMVYGSGDPETHTLLNYMTGKPIPYEDFLTYIYPENPELILTDVIMPKLDSIQLAELDQLLDAGDQQAIDIWVQNLCFDTISIEDFDSRAYNALWEMHGIYNSPRIHIEDNPWDRENADNRASYSRGTIRIPTGRLSDKTEMIGDYFAELSHHIQFQEDSPRYHIRYFGDLLHTLERMISRRQGPLEAQREEYQREGSVEHEAHSIIEPRLRDEFFMRQREVADLGTISSIRNFYDSGRVTHSDLDSEIITHMIEDSRNALLTMEINDNNLDDARRLLEFAFWKEHDEKLIEEVYARAEVQEYINSYLERYNLDLTDVENWPWQHQNIKWFIPESSQDK